MMQAVPHLFKQLSSDGILQGTSYDLKDGFGKTPLHIAAASGHTAAVDMLLANNADPNVSVAPIPSPLLPAGDT